MGGEPPTPIGLTAQRREAELKSLYFIAQAVNFSMPVDDIMELIFTQLKRVIEMPSFCIALAKPQRQTLSYAFRIVDDERVYTERTWSYEEGLTGFVVRTGAAIYTENYVAECYARNILPIEQCGAWMSVPLLAQEQTIGAMVAYSSVPGFAFSEEDESFFVTVASYTASAIERRRLHERLEARARQLDTLNEIGHLLASSLDINEVLDLVVRNAAKLLSCEAGSLLLLDDDSGDLVFRISSGSAGQKLVGLKVPAGKGIAGVCFAEKQPIIVNDAQHDERWYGTFDQNADFVTRSLLAIPLNARGRTIGVLEVLNHKVDHDFTDEDIELSQSFSAQAAVAIENAHLFTMTDQALQDRVEELTTIQHIDRQLNATLEYGEVLGMTLSWALRMTGASIGLIAALHEDDEGQRGLHILAYEGYPEEYLAPYVEEELWPLGAGLVGKTIRRGETLLVEDVAADPDYVEGVPGMKSQLSVPIRREERVIGIIALESSKADCFSCEGVESVARLAEHAAIAIDNARLFQEVQRANQAKTEFVSFVSHELKQPMTSMKGYTTLLQQGLAGPLNEQQQQFLHVISSNVQRLDRLVSDLLDMSRIEAGRLRLEMENIDPQIVADEAVQSFKQAIVEKQQVLDVEFAPDLATIYGDRERLIQVLTNLLSNANKYTPEQGRIALRVQPWEIDGQRYIRWSVEDNGIGMSVAELEKLFTKFFRSSNPEVRNIKGTGLGLVISRSIVELHGGQITVESEAGEGSTFSFLIPVEKEGTPAAA